MPLLSDLTGLTFGRWTVIGQAYVNKQGYWYWNCICECGTKRPVNGRTLREGRSESCGCLWLETITSHGMTKTRTFKSWESMLQRCTNKNDPSYARYGGAGVKVCKRWYSFASFLADMGERPPDTTLDRHPNPNGDYKPSNCRWGTTDEQARNRGNTRLVTFNGQTKLLIDWSRQFGIPYDLLLRRANRGLVESQLFAPSRSKAVSRFKGLNATAIQKGER